MYINFKFKAERFEDYVARIQNVERKSRASYVYELLLIAVTN